jgi:hypothetical protein
MGSSIRPDDVLARVKRFYAKADIARALEERHARYAPTDFYRPIEIVVSGSNACDNLCSLCGIGTVPRGSPLSRRLPRETIVALLDEAASDGFLSYLCSFEAEPFVDLSVLEEIVPRYRGILDPSKINTSCSEFSSPAGTVALLRRLKDAGWTDTAFFVPVLSLSIGLQQDPRNGRPVPLGNAINGIVGFHEVFDDRREATLSISHYYADAEGMRLLEELREEFARATGEDLERRAVVKSREVIWSGRALSREPPRKPIREAVNVKNCFNLRFDDEYLSPTLEVDVNRGLSRRSMCCYHPLGSYPDTGLAEAVAKVNSSDFFRLCSLGGTRCVYEAIEPHSPGLGERGVVDGHEACSVLRGLVEEDAGLSGVVRDRVAELVGGAREGR